MVIQIVYYNTKKLISFKCASGIIVCPYLDDPRYGSVNVADNTPGSTAHYECDKGFKLVGEEYRKCLYNGYWSGDEPVCKRKASCHSFQFMMSLSIAF